MRNSTALLTAITGLAITTLTAASAAGAEAYEIDPKKSKFGFVIQNKPPRAAEAGPVPGTFKEFSGKVVLDDADPARSSVQVEVKTASVDTKNPKRDDHLRNQDFFKVKEFPTMTFKSTKVSKVKGDYKVDGVFTLLGKSKPLSVIFKPARGGGGGTTKFRIKRSEFGMTYRVPDTADEVDVKLEIVAKKRSS